MTSVVVCRTKLLTPEESVIALRRSVEVNPANAMEHGEPTGLRRGDPRRLALVIAHRWPASGVRLSVQFLDNPRNALRTRLLEHMNAWGARANVRFDETKGVGMVRIARLDRPEADAGYWSYVGTEILAIADDKPTMNLEGFTMSTEESEFLRVVRHEAGHTLGFEHEHMRSDLVARIDRAKAFVYYKANYDWSRKDTELQVLTPLKARSLMATTESDPTSIMCYQIPAEITKDGKAIPGGDDIGEKDFAFAARVYPKDGEAVKRAEEGDRGASSTAEQGASYAAPGGDAIAAAPPEDALQITILDAFDPVTGEARTRGDETRFARVLASYAGARVMQPMRLRADGAESTRYGKIISMHERIKTYTNRESGTLPLDGELMGFGDDLFETLFQGEVRRLYDEARARQQGRKLDVVLTSMIPWVAEKPWEFAYDRTRKSFLATEEVHFIRNALAAVPADRIAPRAGPLRILVVSAQPVGFGLLSIGQEVEVIRRGFDQLVTDGLAEVEAIPRVTPTQLLSRLSTKQFDIVHFIGHGAFDEETGVGSLVFEDGRSGAQLVGERQLREIFCGRGIRLVFLNACQTGTGGRADFNKGVAQALVSHGLPALVANQYSVLDSSATSFAQHFYWALAQGMGVGQAAREVRVAVNCSIQGEIIDWAIPVVYARDPAAPLCERPARTTLAPAAVARDARARRRDSGRVHVGMWDVDGVFPRLEDTLAKMNAAQKVFEFERVTLSAPVDIWDLDNKAPNGTPYLQAEKLAWRVQNAPGETGVHVLACLTRHWMRSDITLNIYSWWPEDRKPPVVVASFAGFDELLAEGPRTDRALANLTVIFLAGYMTGSDTHPGGSHSCPMWRNSRRRMSHIAGVLKFDQQCREKLAGHKRELKALEGLLEAFK